MSFPGAQRVNHLPAVWETWIRSLGWEDPLEKEMATHSSTVSKTKWVQGSVLTTFFKQNNFTFTRYFAA